VRAEFESRFGTLQITIAEFTATHAKHVAITDVCTKLPAQVAGLLAAAESRT
jgi:hypothetical protein